MKLIKALWAWDRDFPIITILLVSVVLLLTGCASGYQVEEKRNTYVCPNIVTYECQYSHWSAFVMDKTLLICDTKQECNVYCDSLRGK